jgi:hypothetical protein
VGETLHGVRCRRGRCRESATRVSGALDGRAGGEVRSARRDAAAHALPARAPSVPTPGAAGIVVPMPVTWMASAHCRPAPSARQRPACAEGGDCPDAAVALFSPACRPPHSTSDRAEKRLVATRKRRGSVDARPEPSRAPVGSAAVGDGR